MPELIFEMPVIKIAEMTAKNMMGIISEIMGIIKADFISYEVLLAGLRMRHQQIAERADLFPQSDARLNELDVIIQAIETTKGGMNDCQIYD